MDGWFFHTRFIGAVESQVKIQKQAKDLQIFCTSDYLPSRNNEVRRTKSGRVSESLLGLVPLEFPLREVKFQSNVMT